MIHRSTHLRKIALSQPSSWLGSSHYGLNREGLLAKVPGRRLNKDPEREDVRWIRLDSSRDTKEHATATNTW